MWTDKGDPLLAHWQYGLGRAVAFTSDAKARWARIWLNWDKYRQFWSQIGQWSMRRLENADFTTEVAADKGEGLINVEALDDQGNFRNFLNLQAVVVSPKGERQTVRLEQTGPGHYEARFPTKEVGAYLLNLMDVKDGQVRGSQVIGTSINYSPEFNTAEPNLNLLRRIAESGGGKTARSRRSPPSIPSCTTGSKTFQPRDLWESLLKFAIILFTAGCGRAPHPDWPRRVVARPRRRCAAGSSSGAACRVRRKPRSPWRLCWPAANRSARSTPLPPSSPAPTCSGLNKPPPCPCPARKALPRRRPKPAAPPPGPPQTARGPSRQHRQPPAPSQAPRPETQVSPAEPPAADMP